MNCPDNETRIFLSKLGHLMAEYGIHFEEEKGISFVIYRHQGYSDHVTYWMQIPEVKK